MKPIDPKWQPKTVRAIAKWMSTYGVKQMPISALQGTRYWAPPGVPPLVHELFGYSVSPETGNAMAVPTVDMYKSYEPLVGYYVETLRQAKNFHLTDKMTNLALRTEMKRYKLTAEMLKIGPSGEFVPTGFITFGIPIGQAENNATAGSVLDFRTGELSAPKMDRFSPYQDADFPVVGALWRYHPESNSVWVVFYTESSDQMRIWKKEGLSPGDLKALQQAIPPLAFEREQELPLDVSLNWCDADPANGPLLPVTALPDPDWYPEHIQARVAGNNQLAKTMVSDWVRVLLASWMIIKWKVSSRQEIPPPAEVTRKVAKETGQSKQTVTRTAGTTVVNLGAPIHRRGGSEAKKAYRWKVRALIGPVVRDRQYIPAWDTYDEQPRLIEPYWAGPPDAPISNVDRVFLLDDV